jgi:hypothetical protein
MLVRWTERPVRTRDVKAKHISNLLHQPVRQPTDADAHHGTVWGTKAKPLAILNPCCRRLCCLPDHERTLGCRNSYGSFATLAAIRRASFERHIVREMIFTCGGSV